VRTWLGCLLAQELAFGATPADALPIAESVIAAQVAPPCPAWARGIAALALAALGRDEEAEREARASLEGVAWSPVFGMAARVALTEVLERTGRLAELPPLGPLPGNTSSASKRVRLVQRTTKR
jgi:hypothetical protein